MIIAVSVVETNHFESSTDAYVGLQVHVRTCTCIEVRMYMVHNTLMGGAGLKRSSSPDIL